MPPKIKPFRKAKVFGREVPIYHVEGLLEDDTFGFYNERTKEIGVDPLLRGDNLEHTVIHELFHAVLDRIHCQQQMPEQFVEVVVENLAASVIDNFKVRWKS